MPHVKAQTPGRRIGRVGDLPLLPETVAAIERLNGGPVAEADDATELVLISTATPFGASDLARLPALRHVQLCGTSFGRVDLAALEDRGVTRSNVVDYGDHPAAEVVFSELVWLARGLGPYQWRAEPYELYGLSLVVVGLGALGASMARLGLAYGMRVSHLSRSAKPEWESQGVRRAQREDLAGADVVVLTGPTGVQVLGPDELAQLDGAVVVQGSGGRVMDDDAFRAWIARDSNYAVFDLSAGEDLYADYAGLPRVVFPRVVAGLSYQARQRLGEQVVAGVAAALDALDGRRSR